MRPHRLIFTLCLAEVLGMMAFATFPTLIPGFKLVWGLSNTEAGWISGVFFGGYVVAVGVLTALTDRVDARRIYLASMTVSALAALGFAVAADGVISASLWRFLQGVGLAGTYMPGLKALTDALPERSQSRAVAFYTATFGIGASLSIYLAGVLDAWLGWRWAFALCALGPCAALVIAGRVLKPRPPSAKPTTHLLDFRPVIANRRALGFTLAYFAHNAELFGFRSWIVAFLVYSQSQQASGAFGALWSAATIAAVLNLLSMPASVTTNEIAHRWGRERTLLVVMTLSAIVAVALGFSGSSAFWIVLAVAVIYGITITADSATITAGAITAADPRYRGATMALHSLIGFVGAFLGPIVFGAVLDLAGGAAVNHAWGLAFSAMGVMVLLGPLAILKLVRGTSTSVSGRH